MLLRLTLMIGVVSQALWASDFSTGLFPNQNAGTLRDWTRQALDRQIRSSLLGHPPVAENFLPPMGPNPLLNGHAEARVESGCSIPLEQMKIDNSKQYAIKSMRMPKPAFDSIAKAPPFPACQH